MSCGKRVSERKQVLHFTDRRSSPSADPKCDPSAFYILRFTTPTHRAKFLPFPSTTFPFTCIPRRSQKSVPGRNSKNIPPIRPNSNIGTVLAGACQIAVRRDARLTIDVGSIRSTVTSSVENRCSVRGKHGGLVKIKTVRESVVHHFVSREWAPPFPPTRITALRATCTCTVDAKQHAGTHTYIFSTSSTSLYRSASRTNSYSYSSISISSRQ